MLKCFKYLLNPDKSQVELINKHIGSCRFLYNLALETKQAAYKSNGINLSSYDLIKQLPELKKEYPWLKEVNSQSLQQSVLNLDNAFTHFFNGKSGFPKFKKKTDKQSFTIPQFVNLKEDRIFFPKFKEGIQIVLHRPIKGTIKQVTVSKTANNKYFVSILCETGEACNPKLNIEEKTTIGIDLGIKSFLITSNGEEVTNAKFLKKQLTKLKYTQRKYSKHKGKRTKQKLAKLHEKVANQRKDFLHKVSTKLIRENQSIAVETLRVSNMIKNRKLSQSISDVGWGRFITLLEYKAEWYGVNILKIGTFEPSSKLHSTCGYLYMDLTLSEREWLCPKCNVLVNRDHNAAINIKNIALKNLYQERILKLAANCQH